MLARVPREEAARACLEKLPAVFPACARLTLHPDMVQETALLTCLEATTRGPARQRLIDELVCLRLLQRQRGYAGWSYHEAAVSVAGFGAVPDRKGAWRRMRALRTVFDNVDASAIAAALADARVPSGWMLEGVRVGTRASARYATNPVELADAFCHNYVDAQGEERQRHVYDVAPATHPLVRVFAVRSVTDADQMIYSLVLPVAFDCLLPDGRTRVGYVIAVPLLQFVAIGPGDRAYGLRAHVRSYRVALSKARLPCLTPLGFALYALVLDNDPDETSDLHAAGVWIPLAYLDATRGAPLAERVRALRAGVPPAFASVLQGVERALRDPNAFRASFQSAYAATVDALHASLDRAPRVDFVTPNVIEDTHV